MLVVPKGNLANSYLEKKKICNQRQCKHILYNQKVIPSGLIVFSSSRTVGSASKPNKRISFKTC